MLLKWSEDVMIKFLELYHKHDCLWNHRVESYKNKDARESALRIIVKEMDIPNLTMDNVKNKIKIIRTVYKRELTLVLKSRTSGSEAGYGYEPKLFWFKRADEFLNAVSSARTSSTHSTLPINEDDYERMEMEVNPSLDISKFEPNETLDLISTTLADSTYARETPVAVTQSTCTPQIKTTQGCRARQNHKRKVASNANNMPAITAAINKLDKVAAQNRVGDEDEFDVFGKLIAIQLRQLPAYNSLICQDKIHAVIRQERLQLFNSDLRTS